MPRSKARKHPLIVRLKEITRQLRLQARRDLATRRSLPKMDFGARAFYEGLASISKSTARQIEEAIAEHGKELRR